MTELSAPEIHYVWQDRKRKLFGLPWSFTRYYLTEEKLTVETGWLSRKEEDIRLYRIQDVTMLRSLRDRIWGVGSIHCCTSDRTCPELVICRVKNPKALKEMLSDMVEVQRDKHRVGLRELAGSGEYDGPDFEETPTPQPL